jgi:hypothetical protein
MSIVLQLDATNKRACVSRRNLPSVAQHGELVVKMLTKEVCNSHLIPMAGWVCTCSPWGRHVPQNILIKPGKKPCLIWDGSTHMIWYETSMNMATPMELEMGITFGTTFTDLCMWNDCRGCLSTNIIPNPPRTELRMKKSCNPPPKKLRVSSQV